MRPEALDMRRELKIPLQLQQFVECEAWLRERYPGLRPRYPAREVNSVYLDTPELDDYQDNISGMAARLKTRLRWYDDNIEKLVLELKRRQGMFNAKSSFPLDNPQREIPDSDLALRGILSQAPEAAAVIRRQSKRPVLQVSYQRRYYELQDGIRLTIDTDIRYRRCYPSLGAGFTASPVERVLEIKYSPDLQNTVAALLRGIPARVFRHSKYVVGMDTVCG